MVIPTAADTREHKDKTYSAALGVQALTERRKIKTEDRGSFSSIQRLNSPKRSKGKTSDDKDEMDELPAHRAPMTSKLLTSRTLGANAGVLVEDTGT